MAMQFLTLVPVRTGGEVTEAGVARSAAFFPLVGVLQGAALVAAEMLLSRVFHPDLVPALVLLVLVLSNGGFHLDGLADAFDALAAKGDRERKLSAMKDSSTGAIGVTAIVFSLGLKYLALKSLANSAPFVLYFSLLLMPVISKWVMLTGMLHGTPARKDGLGRIFIEGMGRGAYLSATGTVFLFMALPVFLLPVHAAPFWHLFNAGVLAFFYCGGRALYFFFQRKFGGLTGDTLGAAGEISENVFLLMVVVWSGISIW